MFELIQGIKSILEVCEVVRQNERLLIITDNDFGLIWVGQVVMNLAQSLGAEVILTVISQRQNAGKEPPPPVATLMKSVDAVLAISDKESMVHTTARKEATASGARYYTIFQIPIEDLKRGVSNDDIRIIRNRTEKLGEMLNKAKVARIVNPYGTDIMLGLEERKSLVSEPTSHIAAGLPYYAEAAIAPVEGTAEGLIVADLAVIEWGQVLAEPIRYTVRKGRIIEVQGGKEDGNRMRQIIETQKDAANIAELGIGTSHIIPRGIYGTRRDAARLGTAHFGIGRNDDIGGQTWSPIHLDNLFSRPTIELDNHVVISEGNLLI